MGKMHDPPHPGEVLQDGWFGAGLTVTEAARQLGISRVALSRVLNGKAGISADMALRLQAWTGASAEMWLGMQADYDLWQAGRHPYSNIKPLRKAA